MTNNQNESKKIRVFTGEIPETEMVTTMLNENEIQAFIEHDDPNNMFSFLISPSETIFMAVMVSPEDQQIAQILIDEFLLDFWNKEFIC